MPAMQQEGVPTVRNESAIDSDATFSVWHSSLCSLVLLAVAHLRSYKGFVRQA